MNGTSGINYWGNSKPYLALADYESSTRYLFKEQGYTFARPSDSYSDSIKVFENEYYQINFKASRTQVDGSSIQLQKAQRYPGKLYAYMPVLESLKAGDVITISYEVNTNYPIQADAYIVAQLAGTGYIADTTERKTISRTNE